MSKTNKGKAINLRYSIIDDIKSIKEFGLSVKVLNGDLKLFLEQDFETGVIPPFHFRIIGGHQEVDYWPTTNKFYAKNDGFPIAKGCGIYGAIEASLYDNFSRGDDDE